LTLRDRAQLFLILWGRHAPLTELFLTLIESLAKLGFAEEAFCPLDALLPAATGILNVETLSGLGGSDQPSIRVAAPSGQSADLARPVVTALAAELCIAMKETPWPFFAETDLLDFPGYRGRTLYNFGKFLREGKGAALKELFLRGKVDFLFQRYTAEQELTSMLLCLRPSNLDVTTLPAVIEDWIGTTHGRTAEERCGRPVLLFFCLTMFDQHPGEKAPDVDADPSLLGLRFEARMKASLLDPFAKLPDSRPLAWTPAETFKNCYWIRNPNYKAEGIIQYQERKEIRVQAYKEERIAKLRAAYALVKEVKDHFRAPPEGLRRGYETQRWRHFLPGGEPCPSCRPGMKLDQIRVRPS
jgi:hypothetical protein